MQKYMAFCQNVGGWNKDQSMFEQQNFHLILFLKKYFLNMCAFRIFHFISLLFATNLLSSGNGSSKPSTEFDENTEQANVVRLDLDEHQSKTQYRPTNSRIQDQMFPMLKGQRVRKY